MARLAPVRFAADLVVRDYEVTLRRVGLLGSQGAVYAQLANTDVSSAAPLTQESWKPHFTDPSPPPQIQPLTVSALDCEYGYMQTLPGGAVGLAVVPVQVVVSSPPSTVTVASVKATGAGSGNCAFAAVSMLAAGAQTCAPTVP
jgi:hypothetical protein